MTNMEIVIDAEIVKGYYEEVVLEIAPALTGEPSMIFNRVGPKDRACLDAGGQIEHEWRGLVSPEWFEPWYARLLIEGKAITLPVNTCPTLRRKLEQQGGFPRGSKDFWYIRTAKAVVDRSGRGIIISEDMDFHDPTKKMSDGVRRDRIMRAGNGPVAKLLKKEQIIVKCVAGYLEFMEGGH